MTNLKEEQIIYVTRWTGHRMAYQTAKVVNVTPKGYVDACIGASETPTRFNPEGYEVKPMTKTYAWELDRLPFEQRKAVLETEARCRQAAICLGNIKIDASGRWTKATLQTEADRLQGLLDEFKTLIAAI